MDQARIKFQRDFYHLLLRISDEQLILEDALKEALGLISDISDADQSYVEVRDEADNCVFQSLSVSAVELTNVQEAVSTGIIAETIKARAALLIPSALIDPRFEARESVQRLAIESVLCVPFFGERTKGVLYLHGDKKFKSAAEKIQLDAELFSKHISPLLDEMLLVNERTGSEKTEFQALREQHDLTGIIGESDSLLNVVKSAMMIAGLEVATLLLGETGTGKTSLAHCIHQNSKRSHCPFVEVSCGSVPETLIENELFGSVAGGHSSATQAIQGKVAAADGGTLFLDEVGELSLQSQAKLLQFLQSGEYYPLGSAKLLKADVRIICATNRDLKEMVSAGSFREDLYFRINTFELTLPPLRERGKDIHVLTERFIQINCNKHDFPIKALNTSAAAKLKSANIEGNVRGLSALIERACINSQLENTDIITSAHLGDLSKPTTLAVKTEDFQAATAEFQKQLLAQKLESTHWNISMTARDLKLSRSHVHNLIKSFGLERN